MTSYFQLHRCCHPKPKAIIDEQYCLQIMAVVKASSCQKSSKNPRLQLLSSFSIF